MATRKGLSSKNSSRNLVFTSVAYQDHIKRTFLNPDRLLSDPLFRNKKRARVRNEGMEKEQLKLDPADDKEYVLNATPPHLTLAQRMGLVPAPAERLSEDAWSQVKTRSVQEHESEHPCAICKEAFHLQPQDSNRLKNVGKDSHTKSGCQGYIIQACWRGHAARKWYQEIRKTICPKDKRLRRKFFEEKLQELNDSFVQNCHTDTDAFLSDIDRSLSSSRRVFLQLERKYKPEPEEEDWARIQSQVMNRGVWECPICLTALCSLPKTADGSSCDQRRTALLSCSHLFHQHCLDALETFAGDSRPSCPLCRSVYHKKLI